MKQFLLASLLLLNALPALAIEVQKVLQAPTIDGIANDDSWRGNDWYPLDKPIIGPLPEPSDFSGRYKLRWDSEHLYLLAEIQDDVLFDSHPDPLKQYWDDDCLEIFIDEDASGGNHQFNYNAFAYHIALDNQAVDIGEKKPNGMAEFLLFNEHIRSQWRRNDKAPHKIIWEVAIKLFNDKFQPGEKNDLSQVKLHRGKIIGFMLAYCDNDGSLQRENFIGSHDITPVNGDKNLGYIDASVFGKIKLVEGNQ